MLKRYRHSILFMGILGIALGLRIFALARFDLQFDEVFSLLRVDFSSLLSVIGDSLYVLRPLFLYNLFMNYWQLLGTGEFVLRLSSVLFAFASVAAFYALARELFDNETAFVGAALIAVSAFFIQYAQSLTSYSASICFTILSFYLFLRAFKKPSWRNIPGFIVLNVLNMYLQYCSFFVIVIQCIWLVLFTVEQRRKTIPLWIAQGVQVIIFSPWFFLVLKEITRIKWERLTILTPFNFSVTPVNLLYSLKNFSVGYFAGGISGMAGLCVMLSFLIWGFIALYRQDKGKFFMAAAAFSFPMIFLLLVSRVFRIYADRYVLLSAIFFLLVVAFGIRRAARSVSVSALICIGICSCFFLYNYYQNRIFTPFYERPGISVRKEFKGASAHIKENFRAGDLLIHLSENSTLPVEYYYNRQAVPASFSAVSAEMVSLREVYVLCNRFFSLYRSRPKFVVHDLTAHHFEVLLLERKNGFLQPAEESRLSGYPRVWLLYSFWDGGENPALLSDMKRWLSRAYELVETRKFFQSELYLYEKRS